MEPENLTLKIPEEKMPPQDSSTRRNFSLDLQGLRRQSISNRSDGGESGSHLSLHSQHMSHRHEDSKERKKTDWKKMLSPKQWSCIIAVVVVAVWTAGSVVLSLNFNYLPFETFQIPDSIPKLPSVCKINQTCLFAIGGSIAAHDSFLPTVEAFNGTLWGSEPRLPATCPKSRQEEGKVDPDCEKDGFFGVGVTSHAMVLNDRIYVIGHNRYSGMYSYSGYKEIVTDQLGKEVKRTYWPEFPSLNKRREGFAVVVYRGRIYAIGGRTTCKVESKAENPDSRCITDGHLTRTDQATADRSNTMESIDPENEEAWTVECAGKSIIPGTPNSDEDDPRNWLSEEGSPLKCSLHDRSGACAAVHEDKIYLIGGNDGANVEFFDGEKWELIETRFPIPSMYGASAVSFGEKLYVLGGMSFNKVQKHVILWDGSIFFKVQPLTIGRAYHSAVVWDVCLDTFPMLFSEKSSVPRKSNCEQAIFVYGGTNGTSTIEVMEIATKVMLNQKQKWHMGPQVPYATFTFFGSRAAKAFPPLFCCPLSFFFPYLHMHVRLSVPLFFVSVSLSSLLSLCICAQVIQFDFENVLLAANTKESTRRGSLHQASS